MVDDEGPELAFSNLAPAIVDEGNAVQLTVTLSEASTQTVTVSVQTEDLRVEDLLGWGAATSGSDFTPFDRELTFSPGVTTQTVSVPSLDDEIDEDRERFGVRLSNARFAAISTDAAMATLALRDDDPEARVSIRRVGPAQVPENGGRLGFEVSLDRPSERNRGVLISIEDSLESQAQPAEDVHFLGVLFLRFHPGETVKTIEMDVVDDDVDEPDETWEMKISAEIPTVRIDVRTASAQIVDDDTRGITVVPTEIAIPDGGESSYSVVLDSEPGSFGPGDEQHVSVVPDLPTGLVAEPRRLRFTPDDWQTPKSFGVRSTLGALSAGTTVSITHRVRGGGDYERFDMDEVAVSVLGADHPVLGVDDATASESDAAVAFVVTMRGTPTGPVTVGYESADRDAESGTDYTAVSGRLTFAADGSNRTQTIQVAIIDDSLDEGVAEHFVLTLADAENALLSGGSRATALGTIVDDEAAAFSIGDASAREDGGPLEFAVTLSSETAESVTVRWATAADSALAGDDFTAASGTLTFEPGELSATVAVRLVDDTAEEPAETFNVSLDQAQSPAVIGRTTGIGTILPDDDYEPGIGLRIDQSTTEVVEGKPATFTLVRNRCNRCPASGLQALAHPVEISVTGAFSTGTVPTEVAFAAGSEVAAVVVETVDDWVDEVDGSVTLTIPDNSSTTGVRLLEATSHTARIVDNDMRGITITPTPLVIAEGESGTYGVILDSEPTADVTVSWSLPDGASITAAPASLTFSGENWDTRQSITVATKSDRDAVDEQVEVTHEVVGGDYEAVAPPSLTVRVEDYEIASTGIALSVSPASVTEAGGAQAVVATARLDAAPQKQDTTVRISVAPATATAADLATVVAPVDVMIAAGTLESSATLTVTPAGDDLDEADEELAVQGQVVNGGTTLSVVAATLAITDDDTRGVTVSTGTLAATEGDTISYTLVLTSQPTGAVHVDVNVPADTDVTASPNRLEFTAADWSTARTVNVRVQEDPDNDTDPAVVISHDVRGADYAGETVADVTVSITDITTPTFTSTPVSGSESAAQLRFEVELNVSSTATLVTLDYATANDSAVAGQDYTAVTGTLTFAAGNGETFPLVRTVSVPVTDDALDEADRETFTLVLQNPVGAALADGSQARVVGTIVDDDRTPIVSAQVSSSQSTSASSALPISSLGEAAGHFEFLVVLSEPSALEASVDYATNDPESSDPGSPATRTEDYAATSGALTFAPGETSKTIQVSVVDDAFDEQNEFFVLRLSGPHNAELGTQRVLGEIQDDDTRGITLSDGDVPVEEVAVEEGIAKPITAVLDTQPTAEVTVDLEVTGSTDVSVTPSSLTFSTAAWNQAQTITVTAASDEDALSDRAAVGFTVGGGDYAALAVPQLPIAVTEVDERSSVVELEVTPDSLSESVGRNGVELVVTGTLDAATRTSKVDVTVWLEADFARTRSSFSAVNPFTLTIPAGDTSGTRTFKLTPIDNRERDGDRTLYLRGRTRSPGLMVAVPNPEILILDDDPEPLRFSVEENETAVGTVAVTDATGYTIRGEADGALFEVHATSGALAFRSAPNYEDPQDQAVTDPTNAADDNEYVVFVTVTVGTGHAATNIDYVILVTVTDVDTEEPGVPDRPTVTAASVTSLVVTWVAPTNAGPEFGRYDYRYRTHEPQGAWKEVADTVIGTLKFVWNERTAITTLTVTIGSLEAGTEYDVQVRAKNAEGTGGWSQPGTGRTDKEAGIELSGTELVVTEGASKTYTVALATQPSGDVTVTIGGTTGTDLGVDKSSLTFTTTDWGTAQTVEVTAGQDNDDANESLTLTHTASGGDYGLVSKDLAVTVTDNDTAGLALSATLTVTEGRSKSYTVALATQPTGDVTVTIGGTSGTDLAVDKSSLTFTTSGWSTVQTVTVSAGQDADAVGDSATLTHVASGGDYGSVSRDLAVTVTDDDTAGLELSAATLAVTEGGSNSYTVALATQPTGDVTVTIGGTSGTDLAVDKSSLTFTTSGWSTAQTVTVSAGQDADAVGDSATLTHVAAGADYGSVSKDLAVTVTDDDTVGLELSAATLAVTEGGSNSYTVALATQPTSDVTVTIGGTSGTDLAVDKSSLTFTTSGWSTVQTVTVSAGQDADAVGDSATLTHVAAGGDYGSVSRDLAVTVTDDDTAGLELSAATLAVTEGGSNSYTVALATQPSGDVTVTIGGTSGTDLAVDKSSLTFTTSGWSTAQTVTVSAGQDADAVGDSATLTHVAAGGDYGSVSRDLAVTVTDDDTAALALSATMLAVTEGGSNSYTVALATQPTGDVTVTIGGTSGTDLAVDKSSLTFTTSGWSTAQTVTVSAGQDADAVDDSATLTHVAAGGDYGSVSKDLAVAVTDDDTAGLALSAPTLTVAEGGSKSYTVALATQPTGDVTVTIGGTTGTDLGVDKSSLTFTTSGWSTAQTVTVSAGHDDGASEDSATLTHTAAGGDYGSVSEDLAVTVTDDDTVGLELSVATLPVIEGESATYTVALATQPSGDVTVTIGGTTGTDLGVDKSSLTFTTSGWSTAQTVTVSAAEDNDTSADRATLTHTASGGDYGSVSKALPVTVTDDDTATTQDLYVLFPAGYSPGEEVIAFEGGVAGGSYEVRLVSASSAIMAVDHWLLDATFFEFNRRIRLSPRANVSPAQFVAVYGSDGISSDASLDGAVWNTSTSSYENDFRVLVRYDASAIFANASFLGDQRWGEPRIEVYEGATHDPALSFAWSAVGSGTRNWSIDLETGNNSGVSCKVRSTAVTFDTWPSGPNADGTAFAVLPATSTADSGTGTLSFSATPDFETLAGGGGYNGHRVRVGNRHTLNNLFGEGARTGCSGSVLELIVTVKDAGPPAAVRSLGSNVSGQMTQVDVTWTEPAGFLDGSDNSVVPFDSRRTASGGSSGTAVSRYDYRYRSLGTTPWTNGTTSATGFSITGLTAGAISQGHVIQVRAVNGEGAGTWTSLSTAGLLLSETTLAVAEGGSATYTAMLAEQPSGDVTVAIGGTSGTDLGVDKSRLTFRTSDWGTAQTVTVSAGQDADASDDSATLTHTASGADYESVSRDLAVTVTDDDTAALALSAATLAVTEGGSNSYTVALATQPSGDVTVTIGGTSGTDLAVDKSSLTFTTSGWSTAQTVTVSAGQDADAVGDSATLTHVAAGGDYGSVSRDLAVTVTDDDTAALALSAATLAVTEGGSNSYTVALATQPTGDVTVTIGGTSGTDLAVDKSSLTFTTSGWSTAQTVTVSAGQDADAVGDSATLTHVAAGGDYGSVSKDLAVTVTDDDTAALALSAATLAVTEGGSNSYTVALATQPTGDVTVTIGGTSGTDLAVDKSSLTFTTSGWSTAQTVTVSAGQDADAVGDSATLTHVAAGADYGSVSKDLAVTVTDDDTVGLELSAATLAVTEGGSNSYTVALATQPSGDVTVTIGGTSGTDLAVDKSSLTFTTSGWSTAQTVTVSAGQDADAVGDSATLTHVAAGGDYGSVSKDLAVAVTDDDTAGLELSAAMLAVTEGGSNSYTVALATQPTGDVTVTIGGTSGTDLAVDKSSLTFTTSGWSTAQTVTVSAGQDADAVGDSATLTHVAAGGDYGSVSKDLAVAVTDDDTAGLELSAAMLAVTEGGSNSYTVALATQPTGDVTVTIGGTSGTDLAVDKSSLTFTTSGWSTAQTVTVSAGQDADAVGDSATLTHVAAGGDYGSVSKDLAVAVTDDDTVGLELSAPTLAVTEGGSNSYTVALATQPSGDVTVTIGGTSGTDLAVDKSSLTFTTSDWGTAQTVTVSAGQDADAVGDSATLTHVAAGGDYGSVSRDLAVTVTDDDTAGLALSAPTLAVTEGGSNSYTVALATQPSGDVTVTIGGTSGTDLAVDKSSLTFTTSGWSTAQTVTVSAGQDADAVGDSATLTHVAAGGDYGSVSRDLAVTVTDDDTAGLALSAPTLAVTEGGSNSYTVALATQPSGDVTVTIGGTSGTDLAVDKSSLTFTTSGWSTAQTVTVSAGQDADAVGDSATLTHVAAGGDYGSVSRDLAVTVTDDDTAGLALSAATLAVTEGGSNSYTVALATQPSGDVTVTIGGTTGTDLGVDKSSLTFTTSGWSTAQTVTVSAGQDADAVGDSATLTHVAAGGDYGSVSRDLAVTVTDDDTAALALSAATLAVIEGESATYTVALATQPSGDVTVTIGGTTGTDLGVDKSSLTFTTSGWSTAQTVTVSAGQDADAVGDSATLTHVAAGGDYGSVSRDLAVTVTDDDTAALALSAATLAVTEGGSNSYTVALATQPSGDVTVTIGGTTGTDLGVDKSSLTFTTSDWGTAQTVTVSAGQDADAVGDSATLTHVAAGGDYGSVSKDLAVTVTDDDTVGLELSAATLAVTEGGSNSYTVALATQPSGDVTVTIGGTSGTDLAVDKSSLTFTTSGWSTAQTVTVSAGQDADAVGDSATLTHVAAGGDYGSVSKDLAVAVTDDDTAGLELSAAMLAVTEGGSNSYTVALATQPSGDVTVTIGGTSGTDLAVDKSSLTFTTSGWSTAQTVTVSAGQDDDAVGDSATLTHVAAGADYGSVSKDLAVAVTDDDTAGLALSAPTLAVTEGGSNSYTVALATQPTSDVTVTIGGTSGTDLGVDKSSLTFTTSGWSTAQTVTVSAGQDDDAVGDSATLTHVAAGADYGSVSKDLAVAVTDDDTAGLALSAPTLAVTEGGSNSYTVALATQPTSDVTVTIGGTSGTDLGVDKSSLTFTTSGWSTAQTVTVSAGQDADAVGDSATLTHVAAGADYGSVSKDLAVTVTDDDTVGLELSAPTLAVTEGGSNSYTVALATQPTSDVTVTIGGTSGTDLAVDKSSLTFTTSGWSTAQTVTVSAGQDADAVGDSATLTHVAAGGDYGSVSRDLAVTVTDDDTVGLELSAPTLAVTEGGSNSYTVALATQPSGDVTVTIGGTSGTDLAVDKSSLTFTTSGWSTAQTVTVSAGQDADAVGDSATLTHTASGADYGSVTADLAVTVIDDETVALMRSAPALELSAETLAVTEGGSESYTVALATQPTGEVTVTIGGTSGTDLGVDNSSLTFTTSGWSTVQTVTVSAGHDDDVSEDSATLTHTATGGDYGSVTADLAVTVTDDDTAALALSAATLAVTEGGSNSYTVALATQPSGDVTVTIGGTSGTDLAVDKSSLTFTTSGWSTAQTVTVSAGQDADLSEDSATLTHTASGGGYGSVTADLAVTVTDNDKTKPTKPAKPVLSVDSTTVTEANTSLQFTLRLSHASAEPVKVRYTTADGTATAPSDYTAMSGTFTFSPGNTTGTVAVTVQDDSLDEPDEFLTLILSDPSHAVFPGAHATLSATGTIDDDDDAPQLTIGDARGMEDVGQIVFQVRLDRPSGRRITVERRSEDDTAKAPDDYEQEFGVVTLEPGQTSEEISIEIKDDMLPEPDETFKVILTEPSHVALANTAATGTIIDDDAPAARLWLSRFGRTVATEVLGAVDDRLSGSAGTESQVSVGGHRLTAPAETAGEPEYAMLGAGTEFRSMQLAELIGGSSFHITKAADTLVDASTSDDDEDSGTNGRGGSWTLWSRGGATQFAGSDAEGDVSGQVITGIAGFDYDWGLLLAGVSVAHSVGSGEVSLTGGHHPARNLAVESSLTSVHPYVRVAPDDGVALWALLGYGLGGMNLAGQEVGQGIEMKLAAFGARGALLSADVVGGSFSLDMKSDGFLVLVNTREPAGVPTVTANTSRIRLVLEGALDVPLGAAGVMRPSAELGVRYDAGDAETGSGVELGGGVRYTLPAWGLTIDGSARVLVAHQDRDYREWGASGSLRLDPGTPGRGLSFLLSSSWGSAASATERLWSAHDAAGLVGDDRSSAGGRVNAELGYAIGVSDEGVVTPIAALALDEHGGRTYRLGGLLTQSTALSISLEGTRTEAAGGDPEHSLTLYTTLRW